jgi:hypothetical protein
MGKPRNRKNSGSPWRAQIVRCKNYQQAVNRARLPLTRRQELTYTRGRIGTHEDLLFFCLFVFLGGSSVSRHHDPGSVHGTDLRTRQIYRGGGCLPNGFVWLQGHVQRVPPVDANQDRLSRELVLPQRQQPLPAAAISLHRHVKQQCHAHMQGTRNNT